MRHTRTLVVTPFSGFMHVKEGDENSPGLSMLVSNKGTLIRGGEQGVQYFMRGAFPDAGGRFLSLQREGISSATLSDDAVLKRSELQFEKTNKLKYAIQVPDSGEEKVQIVNESE